MRLLILVAVVFSFTFIGIDTAFAVVEKDGRVCPAVSTAALGESCRSKEQEADNGKGDEGSKVDAVIAWVRSLGGFVDDRIAIRRRDPDDPTSIRGMFVTADVSEGDQLFSIPAEAIISSDNACGTAQAMAKELALGEKSKFAPFVAILADEIGGGAGPPSAWSDAGRVLLDQVLGRHLPPRDYADPLDQWHRMCGDRLSDEDVTLYTTRAIRNMIVPIFVFANHRNGRWTNARFDGADDKRSLGKVASRDIAKGEEIFISYGPKSADAMLRNFGFVESFPQRWVFDFGCDDPGDYGYSGGTVVNFDLDEDSSGESRSDGGTSFNVTWVDGVPPTRSAVNLLQSELVRLGMLRSPHDGESTTDNDSLTGNKVPKEEEELIWQYHRALTFAISHSIAAAMSGMTLGCC